MIQAVLIFNNDGKPRLMNWYCPIVFKGNQDIKEQHQKLAEIHRTLKNRSDEDCSFISGDSQGLRVVYRHYATLYFCFIVDQLESELGILDLIQVFVEALDRVFSNVCELDLVSITNSQIFRPDDVLTVLAEIISGGMVLEVNLTTICDNLPFRIRPRPS